jgi:DNA-binding NarL/FixJ family response regulator
MEADVILRDELPDSAAPPGAPPVVALADAALTRRALEAGVRAVLPRQAGPDQIVAALHAASAGLVSVPAESSAFVMPAAAAEVEVESLTPRELQTLEMLAEGLSNKQIAARLHISDHTAKFHVNSILGKLHAGTRTEAVMRGIRSGLVKV